LENLQSFKERGKHIANILKKDLHAKQEKVFKNKKRTSINKGGRCLDVRNRSI